MSGQSESTGANRYNKRHERSRARCSALQILYQSEILQTSAHQLIVEGNYILEEGIPSAYAQQLVRGCQEHLEEIDKLINDASENWSLMRMPMVDRSLLRLAAYEMLYVDTVPLSVSINEMVELAKDFGGEDESHRFVNGILGRIALIIEDSASADKLAVNDSFSESASEDSGMAEIVSQQSDES